MTLAGRVGSLLAHHWWRRRPSWLATLLRPASTLYGWLAATHKARAVRQRLALPVLVVGNWVAGGAGKTPTVIAVVQALLAAGRRPGVISRGYGRGSNEVRRVSNADDAKATGDEPLLISRRTGVPVWVGADRVAAARALAEGNRDVDVIVSDDGLQHHRLAWTAALVVLDERGVGNGLLLPAGPLRERLPGHIPAGMHVLYTCGAPSTPVPGASASRHLGDAWPLAAWWAADRTQACDLAVLRGRPLLAAAGLAAPEKFFAMLDAAGLTIARRLPLPDHHDYSSLPWPPDTADVITTEKDAT
ncbi:MAG TPA: tetraacyldisaccharide 4'-kinase [Rubrivivax sp.]|nr:tetraacyldisaccharide 4'-kinase [Rubrivivax sp.]